jgi:hypothetical protein
MKDNTREEKIIQWAKYVKENPDKWRKQHTPFINSQINKAQTFYKKLQQTPNGPQKIQKIKNNKK